jgi:hypothetical protein
MRMSLSIGAGRAGAAEDDDVVGAAVDGPVDDGARLLAQLGRPPAGGRGLGVGVGVHREHLLADEVLDEAQRAPDAVASA